MEAWFAELAKKPAADWAQEAVEFVQAEGLMHGDAEGGFRPQSFITRQEAASVLWNALRRERQEKKAGHSAQPSGSSSGEAHR